VVSYYRKHPEEQATLSEPTPYLNSNPKPSTLNPEQGGDEEQATLSELEVFAAPELATPGGFFA
jgi:hypothetical protein